MARRRRFFRRRLRLRRRRFGRRRFSRRRSSFLRRRRFRRRITRIPSNYAVAVTRTVFYKMQFQAPTSPPTNAADSYWFAHNWWLTPIQVTLGSTNIGAVQALQSQTLPDMAQYMAEYKYTRIRSMTVTYVPSGNIALSGDNTPVAGPANTLLNRGNQIPTMIWYIERSPTNAFLGSPDGATFAGSGGTTALDTAYDTQQIRCRRRKFSKPMRVTVRKPSPIAYTGYQPALPPAGAGATFVPPSWADVGRNRWFLSTKNGAPPPPNSTNIGANQITHFGLKTGFWFNSPLYASYINSSSALVQVPVQFNCTIQVRVTCEFKDPW